MYCHLTTYLSLLIELYIGYTLIELYTGFVDRHQFEKNRADMLSTFSSMYENALSKSLSDELVY